LRPAPGYTVVFLMSFLVRESLKNDRGDYNAYVKVGELYEQAAAYEKTAENYRKAQIFSPDPSEVNLRVGLGYSRTAEYNKAADYLEKVIGYAPCGTFKRTFTCVFEDRAGEEALTYVKRLLEVD